MITGILRNRCPVCGEGSVFRGIVSMNKSCPKCEDVFEKEPGFFLGASVAAYFMGAFSLAPTLIICLLVLQMDLVEMVAIASAQLLILTPALWRFSRLTWLYVERRMTHALENKR